MLTHVSNGIMAPCRECGGTGRVDHTPEYAGRCIACDGTGKRVLTDATPLQAERIILAEWSRLPVVAMPGWQWLRPEDEHDFPHHAYDPSQTTVTAIGDCGIRLRADRRGWSDGYVIHVDPFAPRPGKRTVRKIGAFQVGSFGIWPAGHLRGNESMDLYAVEPDHTEECRVCHPALPSGKHLYTSRSLAIAAIRETEGGR